MSATEYPYDATAAYRPSLDDLGGDAKLDDDPPYAPRAGEPQACEWNNFARLHAAAARMLPTASLTIDFSAGAPYVTALTSMATRVVASDFNLWDNGAGDVTISWADGVLPAMHREPKAHSHYSGMYASAWRLTALSVRALHYDGAAGQDRPFTVDIY